MSNPKYQRFDEEQNFQPAPFRIDSPQKVGSGTKMGGGGGNKMEYPSTSDKKLKQNNEIFLKESQKAEEKTEKSKKGAPKKERGDPEHAMHHKEMGDHMNKNDYNGNKIPADWRIAEKHALSRRATEETPNLSNPEVCPCCGYQIQRDELPLCSSSNHDLHFLGSGFPLFYNYILFCILILFVLFVSSSGYNLYTNFLGDYCVENGDATGGCKLNWMSKLSLPNKMNNADAMAIQQNLNLVACILICIILMGFRYSQRKINAQIDEKQISPADYTIIVRNIPTNLDVDYVTDLTDFFQNLIDPIKKFNVMKINLLWEIEEINEIEEKVNEAIKKKKQILKSNGFNHEDRAIKECEEELEKLEEELNEKREHTEASNKHFAGMAFVSFRTEDEKMEVIQKGEASQGKRLQDYLQGSRLHRQHGYFKNKKGEPQPLGEGLFYHGFRLLIDEAPEPNDVNWEFINSTNYDKFKVRTKSYFLTFLLLAFGFGSIFLIKYYQSAYLDEADDELLDEDKEVVAEAQDKINLVGNLNYVIAVAIIFFNKIFVGTLIDKIVETEKITTETRVNISFAHKLTLALFFNTALITLIIEVLISKNYYHSGGLIFTELLICVVDVGFEMLFWIIDPYSIIRYFQLRTQRNLGKNCLLTQDEANTLMETPNYSMSDRYSDLLKTMWFVFMYSSLIPLVNVLFMFGMICFYWIDKYNLFKRRTVKESISIELSTEMIEMLELIIPIYGLSNIIYEIDLFNDLSWQSIMILCIGVIMMLLPLQDINEWLFKIDCQNETLIYDKVELEFDNDYDRENPVTKKKALNSWKKRRDERNAPGWKNEKI